MENIYTAKIESGSREFSKRERLQITATDTAISLNDATKGGERVRFSPVDWALVAVHNPNAKPDRNTGEVRTDYDVFVVLADDGEMYNTSSNVFIENFMHIYDVMHEGEPEEYEIECYRFPSSNNSGDFLTCKII